jgi:hypothetical protein
MWEHIGAVCGKPLQENNHFATLELQSFGHHCHDVYFFSSDFATAYAAL